MLNSHCRALEVTDIESQILVGDASALERIHSVGGRVGDEGREGYLPAAARAGAGSVSHCAFFSPCPRQKLQVERGETETRRTMTCRAGLTCTGIQPTTVGRSDDTAIGAARPTQAASSQRAGAPGSVMLNVVSSTDEGSWSGSFTGRHIWTSTFRLLSVLVASC